MTVEFDDLVDDLVRRGNQDETKEICEPNIMQPLKLETWMVKRSLVAWGLFCDEAERGSIDGEEGS